MSIQFPGGFSSLASVTGTTKLLGANGDTHGIADIAAIAAYIGSGFATSAQGAKADTALQPAAIGSTVQGYSAVLAATSASFTSTLLSKLNGIADGATANSPDGTLLARANHTGEQAISTVTGLQAALNDKQAASSNLTAWSGVNPSAYYNSTQTDGAISAAVAALIGGSPGGSSGQLQYNDAGAFGGSLLWQGTNLLEMYNSTNAQSFALYNTRTDGSNYERGGVGWASNEFRLGTYNAGTGIARDIVFYRGNSEIGRIVSGNPAMRMGVGIISSDRLAVGSAGGSAVQFLLTGSNLVRLLDGGGSGAGINFLEMTEPSAPAANIGSLYCKDNGSGKTQLCVRFNTGAVQVIATEP